MSRVKGFEMIVSIVLGDFSSDGHGISKTKYVQVDKDFAPEELYANYQRNVKLIGFSVEDFGNEYEDSTIPVAKWDVLESYGVLEFMPWGENPEADKSNGNVWLDSDDFVAITMFFYLNGLDEVVSWKPFNIESVPLNAFFGMNTVGPQAIGYGLYGA